MKSIDLFCRSPSERDNNLNPVYLPVHSRHHVLTLVDWDQPEVLWLKDLKESLKDLSLAYTSPINYHNLHYSADGELGQPANA